MPPSPDFNSTLSQSPLPAPLDAASWDAVVCQLSLAPQQERIVRGIMKAQGDKQIANELGIAFPTVRTYLQRVFDQANVEDRIQLIHRVYAIAIDAWAHRQPPHS